MLIFFILVCPPVESVENGHAHGNGTTVGSHYWFTCNTGFTLIGPDTIHCGEDGQWNGTLPKCFEGKVRKLVSQHLTEKYCC